MHWYSDKEHFRGLVPFRIERDLLPRIRHTVLELSKAMDLQHLKTASEIEAARQLLYQISIDVTQLKISVCMTWHPSKSSSSDDSLQDLPLYYYPDLPWGVDHVRDSIIDLFEIYSKLFQAGTGVADDKAEIVGVVDLMDQMIRDLQSPRSAMNGKWRWMVREIEVMDHALVKCLKPRKVRKSNPLEGLEDDKHLEMTQWCPRERMSEMDVKFIERATPIFRLSRLLLNKLSRPTNSKPNLTSRMTLGQLNELYAVTDMMEEDLRIFAQVVLQVRRIPAGHVLKEISSNIKKAPMLLLKHFEALGPDVDQAEIQQGKEWCRTWMAHLDTLVARCIQYCGLEDSDQWDTESSD